MSEAPPDDYERASAAFYGRLDAMKAAGGDEAIVAAIWADVTDRRGWRQEADQFDYGIKNEILDAWLAIVTNERKAPLRETGETL